MAAIRVVNIDRSRFWSLERTMMAFELGKLGQSDGKLKSLVTSSSISLMRYATVNRASKVLDYMLRTQVAFDRIIEG